MNLNQSQKDAMKAIQLGIQVSRATAALPQTATGALFTVTGGRVLVKQIVGEVTTVIQTQADSSKLIANPTAGTDVDLCAALDITAIEVGGKISITGTAGDAMVKAAAGAIKGQAAPVIVSPGTIDLNCLASNSGSVKWDLFYVPLDDGAYVTAA